MAVRSIWKSKDFECDPKDFAALWEKMRLGKASGAVTSSGSGITGKSFLRVFWGPDETQNAPADAEELLEEDWTDYWRENFRRPFRAGNFTIIPDWLESDEEQRGTLIRIDPGMAFGGGDHPTTRLVVGYLSELSCEGKLPERLLDLGSGTGVLSIAASKLGAERCDALDIDPFCLMSAARNAARNGVEGRVRPLLLSLDLHGESYRLILANIVAEQLVKLAEGVKNRLEEEGVLVLSGFMAEKKPLVLEAFSPLAPLWEACEEGWMALALKKRAPFT